MIDHARIQSGFDLELQFGADFIHQALLSHVEAGLLPSTVDTGSFQLDVGPPVAVRLHFPESGDARPPHDVEVDFDASFGRVTVFVALDVVPRQDPRSCLVTSVALRIRYVGLDEDTARLVAAFDADGSVGRQLHDAIDRELPNLFPGRFDRVHLRKLRGEDGHQDCYAFLANLAIKVGPLSAADPDTGQWTTLPPEADGAPVSRGEDPARALPFLPPDTHIALGAPPALYDRLERDLMHSFTRETREGSGLYHRPVMDGGKKVGRYRSVRITPDVRLDPTTSSFAEVDKLRVVTEVTLTDPVDVDVEQATTLHPFVNDQGEIDIDVKVGKPDADTSFWETLLMVVSVLAFGLLFPGGVLALAGIPIGILGGSVLGATAGTFALLHLRRIVDRREVESQRRVEDELAARGDGLGWLLGAVPSRVTLVSKRVDPFFHHLYQVRTVFNEVRVRRSGLSFSGTVSTAQEDRPVEGIALVGRGRSAEPNGDLLHIELAVPAHWDIIDAGRFHRPDPRRPDVFALSPAEAAQRAGSDHLAGRRVKAKRRRPSGSQIAELQFEDGGALTPDEAGELQVAGALRVMGARLMRHRRTGTRFYRTEPDSFAANNLSELPVFRSQRAAHLADRYEPLLGDLQARSSTDTEIWFWRFAADRQAQIPPAAAHLASGLVLLVRWLELIGAGTTPTMDPDTALLPGLDPATFSPEQLGALIDGRRPELVARLLELDDAALEQSVAGRPDQRNGELGQELLDVFQARLRALDGLIAVARREKHDADVQEGLVTEPAPEPEPARRPCDPPPSMP